jgi:hypothetical protein
MHANEQFHLFLASRSTEPCLIAEASRLTAQLGHEPKGVVVIILLLQSALQPLGGFRPAQLSLSILSRKVLQSAVASGTSNPQLGGESRYNLTQKIKTAQRNLSAVLYKLKINFTPAQQATKAQRGSRGIALFFL